MAAGNDFAGKTALVTGAAGNLGHAIVVAFAGRGANLVLIARDKAQLAAALGAETPRLAYAVADLLQSDQVEAAVRAAQDRFGGIDVLCNVAGGFRAGTPVHETADKDWDFLLDINARTLLHAARAVVPRMLARGGGKIVNVGANSALKGASGMGAYTAAKGAVIRLTESMAAELRAKNINVNCVLPTIIDTPDNRQAMPGADTSKWVAPADLANVILFLASDASRAIHGASITVG
jgi:NAD(P)-dependent dehydrogenase (short-subunit alcohol dehydrogenase family)